MDIGLYAAVTMLFLSKPINSRGPRISPAQANGSVVFLLDDIAGGMSYSSFIAANPDYHSVDEDGFIKFRNLTEPLRTSTSSGLTTSYEAGKKWSFDSRNRQLFVQDVQINRDRVLRRHVSFISSLAYDSVTKLLYWSQKKYRSIGAMDASRDRFVTVARFRSVDPHDIAIHVTRRNLFFTVMDIPSRRISATQLVRCDLDGGNMVRIVGYPSVLIIQGLAVDYEDDRIFWTDLSLITSSFAVFSSDLNGRDRKQIFSVPNSNLWGVGVVNGYIYAANILNNSRNEYFIYMSKKDGGKVTGLRLRLRPQYISVYASSEPDTSAVPNECQNNRCHHFCVASASGNHSCTCSEGYTLVDRYRCGTTPVDDHYLIVADIAHMGLFKLPLDQPGPVPAYAVSTEDITKSRIYAMNVDPKTGDLILYTEDSRDRRIIWGNRSIPFDGDVGSIAVHCCKDLVFWATQENIYSWDGKSDEYKVLDYKFQFFIQLGILRIEIDCAADQLYWTEYSLLHEQGFLKRSDLDGKNVEVVLDNLPLINGLTIDYETYAVHVVNSIGFEIFSLPLPISSIKNTSAYQPQYNVTSFASITSIEPIPLVKNIQIFKGIAYLVGLQGIYKFTMNGTTASLTRFGPYIFYDVPTVQFYDSIHREDLIKPICKELSQPAPRITKGESDDDCRDLLAKALSADDDYISSLHVYIKCVIKSFLPTLQ